MKLREKEFFDNIASIFDTRLNVYKRPVGKLRIKKRIDFFLDHCKFCLGKLALEIGCGTGEYSQKLAETKSKIFCIDVSYEMLKVARTKSQNFSNIFYIVADIENLPFKYEVFDMVVGNAVLHHLNLEKALLQIKFVLKPDGNFCFAEPNMMNPYVFLQKNITFLRKLSGDSPGETAFFRWNLRKKLTQAGFRKVAISPKDFLYPYIPDFFLGIIEVLDIILERIWFIREISGSLFIKGKK